VPPVPPGVTPPLIKLFNEEIGDDWWGYIEMVPQLKPQFVDATEETFWFDVPGLEIKTVPLFGKNVVYLKASLVHTMNALNEHDMEDVTKFRIVEVDDEAEESRVIIETEVKTKSKNYIITKDVILHGIDVVNIEPSNDSDELVQTGDKEYVVAKEPVTKSYKVQFYYATTDTKKQDGSSFLGTYLNYEHKDHPVSKIEMTVIDLFKNTFFEQGVVTGQGQTQLNIVFNKGFSDGQYSIQLSQAGVYPLWYEDKTSSGFTLKSSGPINGNIRWTAIRRLTPDWKDFETTENTSQVFEGEGNSVESDYGNS
jgi:hypothetical protein